MALHEGSEFVKGQPKDTNLDTYILLRMGDVPDVEVEFLPSTEAPVGLGEPAVYAGCTCDCKCHLRRHGRTRPSSANPTASCAGSARPWKLTHRSDFSLPDAKRFEIGASFLKRFATPSVLRTKNSRF
jgi:hypothetical protein